jgi:hypothetical protein
MDDQYIDHVVEDPLNVLGDGELIADGLPVKKTLLTQVVIQEKEKQREEAIVIERKDFESKWESLIKKELK